MTKQVIDMVAKLQERDEMNTAVAEFQTTLISLAGILQEIKDNATLDDLDAMAPLFERASHNLYEFSQYVKDCDQIVRHRVKATTDDAQDLPSRTV